jgi:hypothetical protein
VSALLAVFERGEIRIQKQPIHTIPPLDSAAPASVALQPPPQSVDPLTVETTRT